MKPICLNTEGDTVCQAEGKAVREDLPIVVFSGIHYLCGGFVNAVRISEEAFSLNCANCGRLIVFPSHADTVGRLRAHCAAIQVSARRRRKR